MMIDGIERQGEASKEKRQRQGAKLEGIRRIV